MLNERSIQPQVIAYLETPPSPEEVRELLRLLALPVRALLRTGEEEYEALGLDNPALDDDALIAAMTTHSRLIERPVFVHGGRAVIGRPPETVLDLI
ncbi:arsenate reductase (glutaredoxin) [Lysobacter fragariae]